MWRTSLRLKQGVEKGKVMKVMREKRLGVSSFSILPHPRTSTLGANTIMDDIITENFTWYVNGKGS